MKKLPIIFTFLFLNLSFLFGQVTGGSSIIPGELAPKIGINIGPSLGFLLGNYTPPKPLCPYTHTNGNGIGFFVNIVGTYPIDYYSDISASLGYQYNKLKSTANETQLRRDSANNTFNVLMQSDIELKLSYINFDLMYKRQLFDENFYILAGMGLLFKINTKIKQNEIIVDDLYEFRDSYSNEGLTYEGDLPNSNSFLFYSKIGCGYNFYVKNNLIISPNAIFSYPFTTLTTTDTWKVMYLNVGLQFLYVF